MTPRGARGQASVLLLGVICAIGVGAVVLAIVAEAVTGHGDRQRAADLGALAAAAAMRDAYPRLYPWDGTVGLSLDAYRAAARRAAERTVRANDQDGAVAVDTDGRTLSVRAFTGRQIQLQDSTRKHERTKDASDAANQFAAR